MNWLKYKKVYFVVSALLVALSALGLFSWGLTPSVDFKGGVIAEYTARGDFSTEDLTQKAEGVGLENVTIQETDTGFIVRTFSMSEEQKELFVNEIAGDLEAIEEIRFESVGPSIGPDLIKKTAYAMIIASVGILIWVAFQFKSFKYGASAILAMLHDTFILVGSFAYLGHFLAVEVDFLFVTALLTTLSFSVHDTIVVFDRVRELRKKERGEFTEIGNRALSETMVRSLNNSFTIIFMLVALVLLGGESIKWFAVALLIGTVLGTYSSPFVAVPLLVTWYEARKR